MGKKQKTQRDAPYSTTASRNRLDTAQMATTSHTFVAALAAPEPLSASDTLSVAVAERAGSPWSRTTITSLCRGPSASSSARAVLTSPLYSPTRNGPLPRAPPAPPCNDPTEVVSLYLSP
uniref:Uncharacterized protein n=1 Tax=Malurus cyaneus samueli TaxID=2593467 RepID=A0A8C5U1J0_9PASS